MTNHETGPPLAVVGGRLCTDLLDVTSDLAALDSDGFWAVVIPYVGSPVCAKFGNVRPAVPWTGPPWAGPTTQSWQTSLDEAAYKAGVSAIREHIAAGEVYQVNLTRVLRAPLPTPSPGTSLRIEALGAALAEGNPAPFSAVVSLPDHGLAVASASPERFLSRDRQKVWSSPIKGTSATRSGFTPKDEAENIMIVDLVRNDLGRVCEWGSIKVPELLSIEEHPGLFHLVSTVSGTMRSGLGWKDVIDATFPPGSITGAPKIASCRIIERLETKPRGVYCGAIGWVDADKSEGDLNVAIRSFWIEDDHLHFGTGGGITWDSDPAGEWQESELKAFTLLNVARGVTPAATLETE